MSANRAVQRPRLKPTVEVFPGSDGCMYLLRPGGDCDLVIRDFGDREQTFFGALDGQRDIEGLVQTLPEMGREEVEANIAQLWQLGLVEDAADDFAEGLTEAELTRYDRQLAYFGDAVAPGTARASCQARLREARVVVIGLGGLGSWTVWNLACAGVGRIDGIDGDVVEPSNFNRQVLYREADVGEHKADAAARTLNAFSSSLDFRPVARRLESQDDVAAAVAGADFVVEAADWPVHEIGRWLNRACGGLGIPHIAASQFPPFVRVGPTFIPGTTGCLECQEEHARREYPLFDELARWRMTADTLSATFAPACSVIGGVTASDVIHYLAGLGEPATLGAALLFDLRTMEVTRVPVEPVEGCPVCSSRVSWRPSPASGV